jgi:hypothetical protein
VFVFRVLDSGFDVRGSVRLKPDTTYAARTQNREPEPRTANRNTNPETEHELRSEN